jgi:hypothetical protein
MFGAAEGCKLGLEGPHFRSKDKLRVIQNLQHSVVDGAAKTAALRGKVDERNSRKIGSHIHW